MTAHAGECPTPWKTQFATVSAAGRTIRRFVHHLRTYPCVCGWLHLTSKVIEPASSLPVTDQVAALGDVEFATLAVQDVQQAVTPVQAGALRAPVNVDRWLCALTQLLTGLEVQFENRAADLSPEAEAWRKRSTAFRSAVLERIGEASGLVREIRLAEAAEPAGRGRARAWPNCARWPSSRRSSAWPAPTAPSSTRS